ncbi:hypothetical protein AB0F77_01895 [Streptomyces sp. NPDC026672]|uniref:hypothetical protein n=1 Tax=unclassified Streptomyces TaxID=2593676 RepID=UPI0033D2F6DD
MTGDPLQFLVEAGGSREWRARREDRCRVGDLLSLITSPVEEYGDRWVWLEKTRGRL